MRMINASPHKPIWIGYEGEDRVTCIRFRYKEEWLSSGQGTFAIRVLRNGENHAYNAQLVTIDDTHAELIMTVTNIELSIEGPGEMQIVYTGADFIRKSPVYRYIVTRAIGEPVDPPAQDVYAKIIESLSGLGEDIGDIQTDIGLIERNIGDLTELATEAKNDLVSAVNEVNEHVSALTVDDALSATSTNSVQNKIITNALSGKADTQTVSTLQNDVSELQTTKANQSDFDDLSGNVTNLWQTAGQYMEHTEAALDDKADLSAFNDLSGTVTGLQTTKADKFYVDTQLATKASAQTVSDLADDVSDLQTGLAGKVDDVQINGTSVVTDGVANVPMASNGILGVVKVESGATYTGIGANRGLLYIVKANDANIKSEDNDNRPIVPSNQHTATFYGLAKVAGHDEKNSVLPVGTYSEEAKTAIKSMLGIVSAVSPSASVTQTATGATITITDASGTTTANIQNGADGISDVQVNGESVVANGVAEIPIAGQYNKFGLFKIPNASGLTVSNTGNLSLTTVINNIQDGGGVDSVNQISAVALGESSFAEGISSMASGVASHAEGSLTEASGDYSHAEGAETIASGDYSHAAGNGTIAVADSQTVIGRFNVASEPIDWQDPDSDGEIFIIGNGELDETRQNAHTVSRYGIAWYQTDVRIGGTDRDSATISLVSMNRALASKASKATATASANGLMSAQDKQKLDTIYADYTSALTALGGGS